jgi:hypothetical protein
MNVLSQFWDFIAIAIETAVHDSQPPGKSWLWFETFGMDSSDALRTAQADQDRIGWPDAAASFTGPALMLGQFLFGGWKVVLFEHWLCEGMASAQCLQASERKKIVNTPTVMSTAFWSRKRLP